LDEALLEDLGGQVKVFLPLGTTPGPHDVGQPFDRLQTKDIETLA
jgi:hypothetical protein